jgi:DNA-binding transcriptional MerR regulator
MAENMRNRLFSQSEVNKIFSHISGRTLRFWMESELVRWDKAHEDRRGIHRQYALENLWQLGVVEELMDLNFTTALVKVFMLIFEPRPNFNPWPTHSLIIPKRKARDLAEYAQPGSGVYDVTKTPGFHALQLVPTDELGTGLKNEFKDSVLVIIVNLQNIVERVNGLVKSAGV